MYKCNIEWKKQNFIILSIIKIKNSFLGNFLLYHVCIYLYVLCEYCLNFWKCLHVSQKYQLICRTDDLYCHWKWCSALPLSCDACGVLYCLKSSGYFVTTLWNLGYKNYFFCHFCTRDFFYVHIYDLFAHYIKLNLKLYLSSLKICFFK